MPRRLAILFAAVIISLSSPSAFAKGQDILKVNKDIEVPKDVSVGDVVAIGGNVTVYGNVQNNIIAVGGSVILMPNSCVGEQIVVVGGELVKDPSAEIGGKVTQVYLPNFVPSFATMLKGGWIALWATISLLALLGFLGLAVLLVALIPEHIGTVVNIIECSFVKMFLWGALWTILIVPIAVMLAISLVGIALIPLEILFVVLALIIGYIAVAIFIGNHIFMVFKKKVHPFVGAISGILTLFLMGFLPLIGPIAKIIFLTAGFGAVINTRFGTIKRC
ncbi:MAG: hypothetical protein WC738_01920 [Candidatus Omnitrophota bacterium]